MLLNFEPITINHLSEMENWEFNQFFPEFDMSAYRKSYGNGSIILSGPAGCDGFAVIKENETIALFEYYPDVEGIPEIGLALHPNLIYKGLGKAVMDEGISFLINQKRYTKKCIYLTVDIYNIPAIKFYKKYGFETYKLVKNKQGEVTNYKMRLELFKNANITHYEDS